MAWQGAGSSGPFAVHIHRRQLRGTSRKDRRASSSTDFAPAAAYWHITYPEPGDLVRQYR
jgi:hypothetical protein